MSINFLTSKNDYIEIPCLKEIMEKVEILIQDRIEQFGIQEKETLIRRFVAGNVCKMDLSQMKDHFQTLNKNETHEWVAFVSYQMEVMNKELLEKWAHEDTPPRLTFKEAMPAIKLKYAEYKSVKPAAERKRKRADHDEDTELLDSIESRMKDLKEKQANPDMALRAKLYNTDVKLLKKNLDYMYNNYGTHIILAGANDIEISTKLLPFFRTTGSASLATASMERDDKYIMEYLKGAVYSAVFPTCNHHVKSRDEKKELKKAITKLALANKVNGQKHDVDVVPWKQIFDKNQVSGWPQEDQLAPKFRKDGRFYLDGYKIEALKVLEEHLRTGNIFFKPEDNPNKHQDDQEHLSNEDSAFE